MKRYYTTQSKGVSARRLIDLINAAATAQHGRHRYAMTMTVIDALLDIAQKHPEAAFSETYDFIHATVCRWVETREKRFGRPAVWVIRFENAVSICDDESSARHAVREHLLRAIRNATCSSYNLSTRLLFKCSEIRPEDLPLLSDDGPCLMDVAAHLSIPFPVVTRYEIGSRGTTI